MHYLNPACVLSTDLLNWSEFHPGVRRISFPLRFKQLEQGQLEEHLRYSTTLVTKAENTLRPPIDCGLIILPPKRDTDFFWAFNYRKEASPKLPSL